jgi:hypothetical protein
VDDDTRAIGNKISAMVWGMNYLQTAIVIKELTKRESLRVRVYIGGTKRNTTRVSGIKG